MENSGFLFAAFAIVWVVVFFYVMVLFRRQRRLKRDIDLMKRPAEQRKAKG